MLASASPRRRDLLAAAGFRLELAPVDIDETPRPDEAPLACCERLARDKARAGAAGRRQGVVLGGDTVVIVEGQLLGKPGDRGEAESMLRRLSGRRHQVASAVALHAVEGGRTVSAVAVSEVAFAPLDRATLDDYLDGGEWEGKAGAYAIQGRAARFARVVSGATDTVIGLPLALVGRLLAELDDGAGAGHDRSPECVP